MIDFILNNEVLYTDTDSNFTTHNLDPHLIGKVLGLMIEELNGNIIEESYFLYGIFGRKLEVIQTINIYIYKHELPKYLTTRIIKSKIEINDDIITLLVHII